MQRKELMRVFFSSFVMTLIAFFLVLSLAWVDFKADRNGFNGLLPALRLEQAAPLVYTLDTPNKQYRLDLTGAERFAQVLQSAEAWVLPEDWRIFSRTSLYINEQLQARKKHRQEQEFYKNAGLV